MDRLPTPFLVSYSPVVMFSRVNAIPMFIDDEGMQQ